MTNTSDCRASKPSITRKHKVVITYRKISLRVEKALHKSCALHLSTWLQDQMYSGVSAVAVFIAPLAKLELTDHYGQHTVRKTGEHRASDVQ